MDLKERARNGWRHILLSAGVPARVINKRNQPCPVCGGRDRFRYTDFDGNGSYYCSGCGSGSGFELLQMVTGWDSVEVKKHVMEACNMSEPFEPAPQRDYRAERREMWGKAAPLGDARPAAIDRYMASRGLAVDDLHKVNFRYLETEAGVELLALVRGSGLGSIHRTLLDKDGNKTGRKMAPGPMPENAHIVVSEGDTGAPWIVAEGIETALGYRNFSGVRGGMVIAAINAQGLEKYRPDKPARCIHVAGDNDASFTGQAAAYMAAYRLRQLGHDVQVALPGVVGEDWNDVWLRKQEKEAAE